MKLLDELTTAISEFAVVLSEIPGCKEIVGFVLAVIGMCAMTTFIGGCVLLFACLFVSVIQFVVTVLLP